MHGTRATLRMGLAAIALMGMPVAGLSGASVLLAAPAMAQKAQKPPQAPKPKKEYVAPYNEAVKAYQAKDWPTALAQASLALPHAQTPQERIQAEGIRTQALAQTGDKVGLAASMEAQLATGAATPEAAKTLKSLLGPLYTELKEDAKAFAATRAYVDEYGGNAQQYAYLMSYSLREKAYPDAQKYGLKALSQARTEGKVPEERWHQLVIRAYLDAGDRNGYMNAIEAAYGDYPKPDYLRAIAQEAEKAPAFNRNVIGLDIFRALAGSGVPLSDREKVAVANLAMQKALPIEAEAALKPLFASGAIGGAGDPDAADRKKLLAQAESGAKSERSGGLATSEAQAGKAATGSLAVLTGEAYIGAGDYAKAVSLIQAGLAKGGTAPGETALAKLHLGIAQLKAGDKEGAKATLSGIQADNGASELARLWLIAAKK